MSHPICIDVEFVYPPIPTRAFDYAAYDDNRAPDGLVGYGPTRDAAVADLLEQLEETL